MRRQRAVVAVLATVVVALLGSAALAQDTGELRIREARLADDGATEVIVSLPGGQGASVDGSAFAVTEESEAVADFAVEPLLGSGSDQAVALALVIDVSGSTFGEPLDRAKQAASGFITTMLDSGVRIGLIAFAGEAEILTPFTDDNEMLLDAIMSLNAKGDTSLYDAVTLAASELEKVNGQRNIVVFSDGADTTSTSGLDEAIAAATAVDAPVTSIGLLTEDLDEAALQALREIGTATGGRSVSAEDPAALQSAFQEVAADVASQYLISYHSVRTEPAELDLSVALADGSASDQIVVVNSRTAVGPAPQAAQAPAPLVATFADETGLYVGAGAAFLAIALLGGFLVAGPLSRRKNQWLKKGVEHFADANGTDHKSPHGMNAADFAKRAAQFTERIPKPKGFDERLQLQLERAGWPMRASEFLLLSAGAALGGMLLGFAVTQNILFGLLFATSAGAAPKLVLGIKISKRSSAFLEQMPDVLQLLSGSLRAGHGLLQAIDTVVQEAPDPTASEFSRVLTEARLGMPLDEALEGMADRLESEDFRWVVLAINIQRQIGGNLANLLDTVSGTLRDRAALRRHVKALTAEGRLSAIILSVMPFAISLYMLMVNPDYMMPLFTDMRGIVMASGAIVWMGIGSLWMRKMVKIEV